MRPANIIDTRRLGDISPMLDGFVHVIPSATMHKHWLAIDCWCEPAAVWSEPGETVVVSHRHPKPKEAVSGPT
jgi:hypothetical protein